jgi:6,7-dimethyl-8-ribityllumazine synthase
MRTHQTPSLDARGLRIGIAVSGYHQAITHPLRDAAIATFIEAGGAEADMPIIAAPGSYELTAVCRALAHRGDLDAVVALGCILTGETTHDHYLAQAVACGLTSITVATGVPVAFGVLTCQSLEQAKARAGGLRGNKGTEAMSAAIQTVRAIRAATIRAAVPPSRRRTAAANRAGDGRGRRAAARAAT